MNHELNPQHTEERRKFREIISQSIGRLVIGAAETLDEMGLTEPQQESAIITTE